MVLQKTNKGRVDISKYSNRGKLLNKPIKKWSEVDHKAKIAKGFVVDKELSGKDYTTYYNPKTGKASIKYRETDITNWRDLTTDALIFAGLQGIGSRFKRAEKVYDRAAEKYGGKDNVSVYGHSLGGTQALHVNKTRGAKAYAYNPGAGPLEPLKYEYDKIAASKGNKKSKRRIKNQKEKAHVLRNKTDPISLFSVGAGPYEMVNQNRGFILTAHSQKSLGR